MIVLTDQLNIVTQLKVIFKDITDSHGSSGRYRDNENGANILSEYDQQAFDEFIGVRLYPHCLLLKY